MSRLLGIAGAEVSLWARAREVAEGVNSTRRNPRYLTDVLLPDTVTATADVEEAVREAKVVLLVTPSQAVRETVQAAARYARDDAIFVSLAKGLEKDTLMRMTEVIAEVIGDEKRTAALSGPNHAEEVSKGIPTTSVVAAYDQGVGRKLRSLFNTETFRVYTNPDVVGVELAGASKNVIALAAGMSDGLGFGDNTKASIMTRGLAEMSRLGAAMGASPLTYMGLAGMGDLIATCTSKHSRNRGLGEAIARGETPEEFYARTHMVAEGATACISVDELGRSVGCELPITHLVRSILYEGESCLAAVGVLMSRSTADEFDGIPPTSG